MTRRGLFSLAALLVAPSASLAQVTFRADHARISDQTLRLDHLTATVGDASLEALQLTRCGSDLSATELTVWPCRCLPFGLGAARARWSGGTSLTLDRPGVVILGLRVPFAPRWWLVWGPRVGLLLPQIALREGLSIGPGVHLPLGRALSADAWVLGRDDGAELLAELSHRSDRLAVRARFTATDQGLFARGSLSEVRGAVVLSLRADGATTPRLASLFARTAPEALRSASEAALGASVQSSAVLASAMEFTQRQGDLGARAVFSFAAPTLHRGASTVAVRGYVGAELLRAAAPFADAELRARSAAVLGPIALSAEARAEAIMRDADPRWIARSTSQVNLPISRRFGGVLHTIRWSVGAGIEAGSAGARVVGNGRVVSELLGPRWLWTAQAQWTLSSDDRLPSRAEARSVLSTRWVSAEGALIHDALWSLLDATVRVRDARGDGLAVGYGYRAPSPWDAAPSWEAQGVGPMDLQGVRARRVTGQTVRGELALALGRGLAARAETAVNVATEAVALVGGELAWRASCGCAGVTFAGLWTPLTGQTWMLGFTSGQ